MKSKIIAVLNAVLKSCHHKPVLVMVFVLGAWLTTATKAHAQLLIGNPDAISTNTDCDGLSTFNGNDEDAGATTVHLWLDNGSGPMETPFYSPTDINDDDGAWYIEDVEVPYSPGVNYIHMTDDVGGYSSPIYVYWYPDDD